MSNKPKCRQERPAESIKGGVAVVWISPKALKTNISLWANTSTRRVATQHWIKLIFYPIPTKDCVLHNECL